MEIRANDPNVERRHLIESELRVVTSESEKEVRRIAGYAAVFNSLSEDLGGFRELIEPGAFDGHLTGADVRALVDHDPSRIVGRTKSGTLTLKTDGKGLRAEFLAPDTTAGRDITESIRRGDVDGMSFGFKTLTDDWRMQDGEVIRSLKEVTLHNGDISVVTYPAYRQTSVAVRALDKEITQNASLARSIRKLEHEFELTEDEAKLISEHRSLLRAKVPDLAQLVFTKEERGLPLSILKLRQQLLELEI